MSIRYLTSTVLATLGLLALATFAPAANAAVTHEFLKAPTEVFAQGVPAEAFGKPVAVPGALSGVASMAAVEGHLWVAERLEGQEVFRTDEFNAVSGVFEQQLAQVPALHGLDVGVGVGVVGGEREVYVGGAEESNGVVAVFGASGAFQHAWSGAGTPNGSFTSSGGFTVAQLGGVAVDGSGNALVDWAAGDVFVATASEGEPAFNVVDVFAPSAGGAEPSKTAAVIEGVCALPGGPVPACPGSSFARFKDPTGVTVSAFNGDVYVVDAANVVDVFEPTVLGKYNFVRQLSGTPAGAFERVGAVAVDGGNGDVYVTELGNPEREHVDQFDHEGVYVGQLTATPAGPFHSVAGIAVDSSTHRVYVGDLENQTGVGSIDVFSPDLVIPDVVSEPATAVTPSGAVLHGTIDPRGEGEASCRFAWGAGHELSQTLACPPVAEGSAPVAVEAELTGLRPDTEYCFRLQSQNKNGLNAGEPWQDQCFTTPGPGLGSASVRDVAATSATFEAEVTPHGRPTSYFLQYGTTTGYGLAVPASPGIPVGEGEAVVHGAPQHVQGLTAGTVYHYRLVALSELEPDHLSEFDGPDQTFATQPAASTDGPPDNPQREQVSPANKHGAVIKGIGAAAVMQASLSGDAITFRTNQPTGEGAKGYYEAIQLLANRGPSGWASQQIALPHDSPVGIPVEHGGEYRFFSEDLTRGLAEPIGNHFLSLAPEVFPADTETTPYIRHDSTCATEASTCFEPLLTAAAGYADVPEGVKFGGNFGVYGALKGFIGASDDLQNVVFASKTALTAIPIGTGEQAPLYEWSAARSLAKRISLVTVLPTDEGATVVEGELGSARGLGDSNAWRAISTDGSRVFWTARTSEPRLYMRDTVKEETIALDRPSGVPSPSGQPAPQFQFANKDGSIVFFTDEQALTPGSGAQQNKPDLYECVIVVNAGTERDECQLHDLTPHAGSQHAAVQGLLPGASADSSHVYFVADGVLSSNVDAAGERAVAGAPNLYLIQGDPITGAWGEPQLVAVLGPEDSNDWGASSLRANETARVSGDGRFVVFMSDRSLTGYDNRDLVSRRPDEEVFLFDDASGVVRCASCNPSGGRPSGREYAVLNATSVGGFGVWNDSTWLAANVPGWTPYEGGGTARYQSRYLSDSGRLFFNSSDALVPQDVNGQEDVYEFDPVGVAGCVAGSVTFSARDGGCVSLVSSGHGSGESAFVDASESGNDVFYLTGEQEVPSDKDTSMDVYDAHVCSTVVPCLAGGSVSPACVTVESCRSAPAAQPGVFGAPASATFSGAGNVVPLPPPKARVLTRAQRLAAALKRCNVRYRHSVRRRARCKRLARKASASRRVVHTRFNGKAG